jgi:hypothetical protein
VIYRFILYLSTLLLFSPIMVVSAEPIQIKKFLVVEGTPNPLEFYLYPGQGVTLDYGKAGQTVETIFLDNRRFVALDTDGCLNGLNGGSCAKNEATMLHLRLIDSLPGSGVVDRINKSLLTVVTTDSSDVRRTYLYRIRPSLNTSDGDGTELIEYVNQRTASTDRYTAENILAQLKKGTVEGWLVDPSLIGRVRSFADYLRQGLPVEVAADKAKISMKFVNGLVAR